MTLKCCYSANLPAWVELVSKGASQQRSLCECQGFPVIIGFSTASEANVLINAPGQVKVDASNRGMDALCLLCSLFALKHRDFSFEVFC
jgi:hypothetical protein